MLLALHGDAPSRTNEFQFQSWKGKDGRLFCISTSASADLVEIFSVNFSCKVSLSKYYFRSFLGRVGCPYCSGGCACRLHTLSPLF
ncbi:hypothetical protein RRG08_032680 [Elysia crispata]|uniref:Uncharacterized protein n=1 Tax=Elysia crispata TaxID=231223 RepID=A0AAE1CQM8_9GAST|nr:hypothetical protein RRG08_032680 [Elysia crispata]